MFRILSLDGGGARGVFPAHFLAKFSQQHGADLTKIFDLIVGTSTGSIIAAAAATKVPMDTVVGLYEARGQEIFTRKRLSFRGYLRSRYDSTSLHRLLSEIFADQTMSSAATRLILAATDVSNGNVFVIKSPYLDSFVRDATIPLVDAVMASCAAPSYFDPVRIHEYLLADGGLWAANPSVVAYSEAVGKLGVDAGEVRILSLGTGTGHQPYDIGRPQLGWGMLSGWGGTKLVDTFLNLQSRASSNSAGLLLRDRYLRLSFDQTGALPLDDASQIPGLKAKAGELFTYRSADVEAFLHL